MLAQTLSATPWGIEARAVEVEAHLQHGIPAFHLVGLPDTAVRESRDRVRSAILNCGYRLPARIVVVNLAPADLRKEGNHLDLAIALAMLGAHDHIPVEPLARRIFCGELGLDGQLRPIRGGLAIAALAHEMDVREILVPAANAAQAAALGKGKVIAVHSLREAIDHVLGVQRIEPELANRARARIAFSAPDLAEVRGQESAKRALEIAAAGGHNLLMVGPPGTGKTLLARCLPRILPPLTRDEAILATQIQSVVAERPALGLLEHRPFRAPHSTTSTPGLIGGGSVPRPGEVTLAHSGVLFLDELPEFRRDALESLRQPMEDGCVTVVRARARMTFPARFALVAAMNPCKCGHRGNSRKDCRCTPMDVERYAGRISGPLLDRIDLRVEVPSMAIDELRGPKGESSEAVSERVTAARAVQVERLRWRGGMPVNAALDGPSIELYCSPDEGGRRLLDRAYEKLGLSPRSVHRILKVARTLADLEAQEKVRAPHVAEAIQYRTIELRWDD